MVCDLGSIWLFGYVSTNSGGFVWVLGDQVWSQCVDILWVCVVVLYSVSVDGRSGAAGDEADTSGARNCFKRWRMSTIYQKIVAFLRLASKSSSHQVLIVVFGLGFLLLLGRGLLWPHPLGLADNHDYWRLSNPFGLYTQSHQPQTFIALELDYVKTTDFRWEELSTGLVFVGIAYVLSGIASSTGFSLLLLGFVHCVAYSCAFFRFLKALVPRKLVGVLVLGVLAALVLSDSLFTSYFVSFYQESAFFILALLWVGLFLDQKEHFWWELLVLAGLILSKVSQSIDVVLLMPLLIKYRDQSWGVVKMSVVVLLCPIAILTNFAGDQTATQPNIYNSFFTGLVSEYDDQHVLGDFGLDAALYARHIGQDFWSSDQQDPVLGEFYQKVDRSSIVGYYVTHPLFFGRKLVDTFVLATDNVLSDLETRPAAFVGERSILVWWQWMLPYLLYLAVPLSLVQAAYFLIKRKLTRSIVLILALTVLVPLQFITVFLGDGVHELSKHLAPCYFFFSIWCLVSLQYWWFGRGSAHKSS